MKLKEKITAEINLFLITNLHKYHLCLRHMLADYKEIIAKYFELFFIFFYFKLFFILMSLSILFINFFF